MKIQPAYTKIAIAFFIASSAAHSAYASIIERTLYSIAKIPESENYMIEGYVISGTFDNGSPTVTRLDDSTIRFYVRSGIPPNSEYNNFTSYWVQELNCTTGSIRTISAGTLNRQRAFDKPHNLGKISDGNPNNIPVYTELCREGGATQQNKQPAKKTKNKPRDVLL